jgi:hypothetical protein
MEEGKNSLGNYMMQNKLGAKFCPQSQKPMPPLHASERAEHRENERRGKREERGEREKTRCVKRAVREFEIWGFEICV